MNTPTTAEYAAILSTFLFIIKIYEMIRDRFRIDAYLSIDGPESDKSLVITNLSSKAIHQKSFQIYWASSKWFKQRDFIPVDHDVWAKTQIGAYTTKELEFSEQKNFGIINGKHLYLKLNIAGQKFFRIKKIY